MKHALPALCAAVVAVAGCSRVSAPDSLTILARNHGAEETTAYTVRESNVISVPFPMPSSTQNGGSRFYTRPVTTVLQHTQFGPNQYRYDTLQCDSTPESTGMVTARNGEFGWQYVASARRLQLLTFPAKDVGALNWMALLLANYTVEGARADRVAGVPAWRLEVRPKSPGRPMSKLWVDRQTYLPLRKELWSPDGRLLRVTRVLERPTLIPAGDFSALNPPSGLGVSVVLWDQEYRLPEAAISAALGYPLARLGEMPPGFVPLGVYLSIRPDAFGASARWELTDGLATISITQTRATGPVSSDAEDAMEGDFRGPSETSRRGPFRLNVRGNLPRRELRRIADTMVVGPR